jgi:transaldolase
MSKAGVTNQRETIEEICSYFDDIDYNIDSLSVELLDPTRPISELFNEAMSYAEIDLERVIIKIPFMNFGSLELAHDLHKHGIGVNMTCIMSAYQGILAYSCRPEYISFFYNRMVDYGDGKEGNGYIYAHEQIKQLDYYIGDRLRTNIICGSIRYPKDVSECFNVGADIVTVPYNILLEMFRHVKTTEAIEEFTSKWKNRVI